MIDPASDISVALATYNGSRYLAEQLKSIAAQTLRPAELLVFDDGSSPQEREAIRALVADFPGATFVPNSNVGITANFARAIAGTSHPYVALADQDDIWTPDHLAALRDAIGDADLAYGDMLFMNAEGMVSDERFSQRIRTIGMTSDDSHIFEALLHNSVVWGASALFRRDLIGDKPIPDTRRYHDWWLSMLALMRNGIRYVDHALVHHRIHAANSSHHLARGGVLGAARKVHRRAQAERTRACLEAVRDAQFALTARQQRALDEAIAYADSLIADKRRIWRAAYAFRHRETMTPDSSRIRQIAIALAKLH